MCRRADRRFPGGVNRGARGFDFRTKSRAAGPGWPARGFTLLEILVALAILAIALAAGIRALGQSVDASTALRERMLAQWFAEDRFARQTLNREWPAIDTTEGKGEFAEREWYWRQQVSTTPVEKLRRIDLSVMAQPQGEVLVKLTGFVRQP